MIQRLIISALCLLSTSSLMAQLSVSEYVERVVKNSHTIVSAEARVDGAEAEYRVAQHSRMPSLALSSDDPIRSVRADIVQPIYNGGRYNALTKQREMSLIQSSQYLDRTMLDVRYEAEIAYWSLSQAERYRQAMYDYISIVKALKSVAEHRYKEGYTSKSDLLQVESRLSDAEYQLSEAEQSWRIALSRFNILQGVATATEVTLSEDIFDSFVMPQREDMVAILSSHPDYLIALAEREQAQYGIALRKADYLPSLNLGIFGRWPLISNGVATGGILLSMKVPIFHFMERRDAIRSAQSSYNSADAQLKDVVDNIILNESNGWTNLEYSHRRMKAVQRNLDIARENLDISTYSYREGVVTILDVLQAQISWLQIYENAITAEYDYAVAIASYRYIVGGVGSTTALEQHE